MTARMHRLALLALVLLPWATRAVAEEPGLPTPDRIDTAIERGVAWLLAEAAPGGHYKDVGRTALVAFTLHHCGLHEDQQGKDGRRLGRAMRWLASHSHGRRRRVDPKAQTYDLSLELMLLRLRGRPADRPRMERLCEALWKRQARNGQWWYDARGAPHIDAGDNSNTQFALLGLGHAQAAGLAVPAETWQRARAWWTRAAGPKGGFGYASGGSPKSAATGSMTAAGIACLALCEAALGAPGDRVGDAATRAEAAAVRKRAVAFLADVWSVKHNHGPSVDRRGQRARKTGRGWLHYYLWSVERAMVLAGHERLGPHDWYAQGAARLLATQKDDGSWRQEAPLFATCFALLFLTRAADPPRVFTPSAGARRRPTGPVTGPAPEDPAPEAPAAEDPADGGPGREPGTSSPGTAPPGGVADWLRTKLPPGELAAQCRRRGAGTLPTLVAGLDDRDAAVRRRAWEALTALLAADRIARADRHPLARGRLALWVRLHAPDLVLREGRFVVP